MQVGDRTATVCNNDRLLADVREPVRGFWWSHEERKREAIRDGATSKPDCVHLDEGPGTVMIWRRLLITPLTVDSCDVIRQKTNSR